MGIEMENNPFVGLRPFESDESLLFFGRQDQIIELLERLHQHHFVGVVGSSGCGKSSLIRAGLIPKLKAGYLVNDRDHWALAVFKPGEDPFFNFATALLQEANKNDSTESVLAFVQKIREEGADAVIDLFQSSFDENRTNLFILVDQFEELFRFSMEANDAAKMNEAIDFVNILLELSSHKNLPVYVVITMRSDFIGDCSQFFGLPEALNKSQYLVPRLHREQLKNAIEGPVRLFGGIINQSLTSRLLNDVQKVKDELPLLQHVLMRCWDYEMKTDKNGELDLNDYTEVGGIEKALSMHADEAMDNMNKDEQSVVRLIFQALTAVDTGGRKIRRPEHLRELAKLSGTDEATVNKIINHFNDDKRLFLVVNKSVDVNDPLIDISHESLIRQWDTLSKWVDEETESSKIYLRICEAAQLYEEGDQDLLRGTGLQVALNWYDKRDPELTWAGRYNNKFNETIEFLEKSKMAAEAYKKDKEEKEKKKLRRARITIGVISLVCIIAITSLYFAVSAVKQQKETTKRMLDMQTEEIRTNVESILIRADSLKEQYPDVYKSMKAEVYTILGPYLKDSILQNDSLIKLKILIDSNLFPVKVKK